MKRTILIQLLFLMIAASSFSQNLDREIFYTQADRDRMVRLETKIEEMDKRMNDMNNNLNNRIDDTNNRIDEVKTEIIETRRLIHGLIYSIFGLVAVVVGLAVWDRQTVNRPLKKSLEEEKKKNEDNAKKIDENTEKVTKVIDILKKTTENDSESGLKTFMKQAAML